MEYQLVATSRNLFNQKIEAPGMQICKVVNEQDNWILPFLTTLVPEEADNNNDLLGGDYPQNQRLHPIAELQLGVAQHPTSKGRLPAH